MAGHEIVKGRNEFNLGEVASDADNSQDKWFHRLEFITTKWEDMGMRGFVSAMGIVGYISLFTVFITYANKVMPGPDPVWAPLVFLTIFCFSVMTCGLIVFYKPYMLFIDKKGKEAGQLVLGTTKWLGIFALVVIAIVAILSR